MKKTTIIFLAAFISLLLLAGCLNEAEKTTCCERDAAFPASGTGKCVLSKSPTYSYTTESCDKTNWTCTIAIDKGTMKVPRVLPDGTVKTFDVPVTEYMVVPVCGEKKDLECVRPDCVAMVCGDFLYRPRFPPPMPTKEELEEGSGGGPTIQTQEISINLYHADCRMRAMDEELKKIMKRSGVAINNIRFGAGSSFNEYNTYEYYFPISDKFCGLNSGGSIDRYMNYYLPCAANSEHCNADMLYNDVNYKPLDVIPPSDCLDNATAGTVDRNTYPFLYGLDDDWHEEFTSYRLFPWGGASTGYYANALSASYFDTMFKEDKAAPFECGGAECLSAYCSRDSYKRGFAIKNDSNAEVPSYCYVEFQQGHKVVICLPVTKVSHDGDSLKLTYDSVDVYPTRYVLDSDAYDTEELSRDCGEGSGEDNLGVLAIEAWQFRRGLFCNDNPAHQATQPETLASGCEPTGWCSKEESSVMLGPTDWTPDERAYPEDNIKDYLIPSDSWYPIEMIPTSFDANRVASNDGKCPGGFTQGGGGMCYATNLAGGGDQNPYPPAAYMYFFGRDVSDGSRRVIGYAVADKSISDWEFVKNCNMQEDVDYVKRDVRNYNDGFALRVFDFFVLDAAKEALTHIQTDSDGDEREVGDLDIIMAGSPWVLAYIKNKEDINIEDERSTYGNIPLVLGAPYRLLENRNVYGQQDTEDIKIVQPEDWYKISSAGDNAYNTVYALRTRYFYEIYSVGDCKLDNEGKLPEIKEYGWCEPCTYQTLAYENGSTFDKNIEDQKKYCEENPGMGVYGSYCKEEYMPSQSRITLDVSMINYLENGVIPVVDYENRMDMLNYQENEYGPGYATNSRGFPNNLGPVITIVPADKLGDVRVECDKCLPAVTIGSTGWNEPMLAYNAKVLVLRYDLGNNSVVGPNVASLQWARMTSIERAATIASDIANESKKAILEIQKVQGAGTLPVLVLLNVRQGGNWPDPENDRAFYQDFFTEFYKNKDALRQAGVMGIQYVGVEGTGSTVGSNLMQNQFSFGPKFCAFELGSRTAVQGEPIKMTIRVAAVNETNPAIDQATGKIRCVQCQKELGCVAQDMICDDGSICIAGTTGQQCPKDVISSACYLCSQLSGMTNATYRNASSGETYERLYPTANLSDADADIIAALPVKCCLNESSGNRYTYSAKQIQLSNNLPVIFSSTMNPQQDCGILNPFIATGAPFCGIVIAKDLVEKAELDYDFTAVTEKCNDYDPGPDYMFYQSYVVYNVYGADPLQILLQKVYTDNCSSSTMLKEYACRDVPPFGSQPFIRPYDCTKSTCRVGPTDAYESCVCANGSCDLKPVAIGCNDRDAELMKSGKDIFMASTVLMKDQISSSITVYKDFCVDGAGGTEQEKSKMLKEWRCDENGQPKPVYVPCDCNNSACNESAAYAYCFDADVTQPSRGIFNSTFAGFPSYMEYDSCDSVTELSEAACKDNFEIEKLKVDCGAQSCTDATTGSTGPCVCFSGGGTGGACAYKNFNCVESDYGQPNNGVFVKGSITFDDENGNKVTRSDQCLDIVKLDEMTCILNGQAYGHEIVDCSTYECVNPVTADYEPCGCLDGKCDNIPSGNCTDTDANLQGGSWLYSRQPVIVGPAGHQVKYYDKCKDENILIEATCSSPDGTVKYEEIDCRQYGLVCDIHDTRDRCVTKR
ncbi:MAG: hypothetical protein V1492_01945 [Candidatus Micrarchaeota archaeon]